MALSWNPLRWFASAAPALPPPRQTAELRYSAGKVDSQSRSWIAHSTDPNAEVAGDIERVRNRARESERNRPMAERILAVWESSVVGTGAMPKFTASGPRGAAAAAQAQALWKRWARESSAADYLNFGGQQQLAFRAMMRDGEALARFRYRRPEDGLSVPLQLQMMEADHLDTSKSEELANGGRIVNGVEFGPFGGLEAYWLYRQHPGVYSSMRQESVRIPEGEVLHLFRPLRAGQVRGMSSLAVVLEAIYQHSEMRRSERIRARANACVFASVEGVDDPEDEGINPQLPDDGEEAGPSGYVEDADGNPVNEMPSGAIINVRHGKSLKMHAPAPNVSYPQAIEVEERGIASGAGIMYEALSGDLSKVNWASFRVGDVRFRRIVDQLRALYLEPLFLDRIAGEWLKVAQASGALPVADYSVSWRWPRLEEVDREKEAKADNAEMRAGLLSLERAAEERGQSLEELVAEHARSKAAAEGAGIILDSLPWTTTTAGQAQVSPVSSVAAGSN